jgi:hypothetical protein
MPVSDFALPIQPRAGDDTFVDRRFIQAVLPKAGTFGRSRQ